MRRQTLGVGELTLESQIKFGVKATNGLFTFNVDETNSIINFKPGTDDTGSFTIGDGTTDMDFKVFLGTISEYALFDVGNSIVDLAKVGIKFSGTANGLALDFATAYGGVQAANALVIGGGTSADPMTTAVAGKVFMEFRTESTATSGDSRSLYLRHSLNDSGGAISGEAIRAFTKLTDDAATARGAHISLDTLAAKGVSGLGVGVDAQILVGDGALPAGGTYAVLNAEAYAAGTSVDISGATEFSFLRMNLGGDDTGNDNIEDNAFAMVLAGGTIAAGNIVQTETDETKFSHKIRIKANGTTMYLMACAT